MGYQGSNEFHDNGKFVEKGRFDDILQQGYQGTEEFDNKCEIDEIDRF